jgi:hypothetical protein
VALAALTALELSSRTGVSQLGVLSNVSGIPECLKFPLRMKKAVGSRVPEISTADGACDFHRE